MWKRPFQRASPCGIKKIRTQTLDGYAELTRNNILMVTSNDVEFKKFTVKFTNKTAPRPVTATEVSSHYIYTLILIFILTKETLITETPAWFLDKFLRIVKLKRFWKNLSWIGKNRNICLSNKHLDISFES